MSRGEPHRGTCISSRPHWTRGRRSAWRGLLGALVLLAGACATTPGEEPADYVFYPDLPDTPRIQYLATIGTDQDLKGTGSWFRNFLYGADDPATLLKPYGLAIRDGKLFAVDTIAAGVAVLDLGSRKIESLGTKGAGRLRKPINIEVDADGTRYVTDRLLQRVMVYDDRNRYVNAFGDPEAWAPTDVAIAGEELYVTDRESGEIVVLDKRSGEELRRLGSEGIKAGEFLFPTNLAIDSDGNIYVSDTLNNRIQKIDAEGKHLRQFGDAGDGLGQFARPKGVAVDRENRVYAVDAAFMNIQIFDEEGQLLLVFGGSGVEPGRMYLPAKVKIDYDNVEFFSKKVAPGYEVEYLILVSNQYGPNKINVYGFLKQSTDE